MPIVSLKNLKKGGRASFGTVVKKPLQKQLLSSRSNKAPKRSTKIKTLVDIGASSTECRKPKPVKNQTYDDKDNRDDNSATDPSFFPTNEEDQDTETDDEEGGPEDPMIEEMEVEEDEEETEDENGKVIKRKKENYIPPEDDQDIEKYTAAWSERIRKDKRYQRYARHREAKFQSDIARVWVNNKHMKDWNDDELERNTKDPGLPACWNAALDKNARFTVEEHPQGEYQIFRDSGGKWMREIATGRKFRYKD